MGEVLTQVWLKFIKKLSELFDIQVDVQKQKNFRGSRQLPQAHKKCVMKIKAEEKTMGA